MHQQHNIDGTQVNTKTQAMGGGIHRVTVWIGAERYRGEYLTIKDGKSWIDENDKRVGSTKADATATFARRYVERVAGFNVAR